MKHTKYYSGADESSFSVLRIVENYVYQWWVTQEISKYVDAIKYD